MFGTIYHGAEFAPFDSAQDERSAEAYDNDNPSNSLKPCSRVTGGICYHCACLNVCGYSIKTPFKRLAVERGDIDVSRLLVDQAGNRVGQNRYPTDKVATG